MPACLFSIASTTTETFYCTGESTNFVVYPRFVVSVTDRVCRSMMERRRILSESMTEIPNRIMLSEVKEVHVRVITLI